jgi:hypothetical protein
VTGGLAAAELDAMAATFIRDAVRGLALMGSYARGDAGPHSDVDLLRLVEPGVNLPDGGSHLMAGRLVTVGTRTPEAAEAIFTSPLDASTFVAGLAAAKILYDPQGDFAALQRRAQAFVWDAAMRQRANAWAGQEMVGLIEEVHKGLEGLRRNDVGRLLNARFGLSWGLSRVMQVARGVLVTGDNAMWDEINAAVGDAEWVRLRRRVFGIEGEDGQPIGLREQVIAGLRFYQRTTSLLDADLPPREREMVAPTVARIEQEPAYTSA